MRTNKKIDIKKTGATKMVALLSAFFLSCSSLFSQTVQNTPVSESTSYSNPLFMVFVAVIIFLLIIIIVLADVVKGSAKIMIDREKAKSKIKGAGLLALLLAFNFSANAQATVIEAPINYGGLSAGMFYTLSFVVVFEVFVLAALIYFIRSFLGIREMKREAASVIVESKVQEPSIIEKLNASVSLEDEANVLLDHNYDGIQELDNNLPPWWKYGFYLTIVFAFIYLIHYHVLKTGDLQQAEYSKELTQAAADIAEYQKKSALSVDENTVKVLVDNESISKGKEIYINNCLACHGKFGEGQVGPNFTDEYWIHGGSIKDIFKVIKYGVVEKGMKSWKEDLSPSQINCVASYIKTLYGTNPPNPKEKQGERYTEEGAMSSTSADTLLVTDTLKTSSDSLALSKK